MLGEKKTVKPATKTRHALMASLLAGTTLVSTGCSSRGFSLASVNPFGKSTPTQSGPGLTESIASTTEGTKNQLSSVGNTAKSAWGKTTDAVAGVFKGNAVVDDSSTTDPLSLSNKPKNVGPEVFVANGQLWESTGDFGKAMESYTKALESSPNNGPALTSIARLHFRKGNFKQATENFKQAIAQNPQDAQLHNDLGLALSKTGDHAAATAALERALQLAPGTSRFANNLASVRYEAGDASSAYDVLEKNNKPAVAHFNMAYLHFKNGQLTEARGHLGEAVRFEPQAAGDAAVQRAVERSRDMLAQIDASMAPVAQAAPQATIAGGRFFAGAPQTSPVQQTSQSGTTQTAVAPAAPTVPSVSGPSAKSSTPNASLTPQANSGRPMPVKPAAPQPTSAAAGQTDNPAQAPSFPFALPTGFDLPAAK